MGNNYLGIDIGGTYIKYAMVDSTGTIGTVSKQETSKNLDELKESLIRIVTMLPHKIAGVGISCPGRVDITTGTVYNGGSLPFLHGFSFENFFSEHFKLPCTVSNDGKAVALAELWLGNLVGEFNAAAVVLGTGVGGGIIVDGKLLQGGNFQAGEFSFLLRSPELINRKNIVGTTGSAVNFICNCADILNLSKHDGEGVFEALLSGENFEVNNLFKKYCREIAVLIMNLQATLDIEKVVIGGGISTQDLFIKGVKQEYRECREKFTLWDQSWEEVVIQPCKYRSNANLLGAIYQMISQTETVVSK